MNSMTLNKAYDDGVEIAGCITEETLLLHSDSVCGRNSVKARVICSIVLPDGTRYHANRIIMLNFKREDV